LWTIAFSGEVPGTMHWLTCGQRNRWHLEKNATQMPAISWRLTSSRLSSTLRPSMLSMKRGVTQMHLRPVLQHNTIRGQLEVN
jgi:hypothetical protein